MSINRQKWHLGIGKLNFNGHITASSGTDATAKLEQRIKQALETAGVVVTEFTLDSVYVKVTDNQVNIRSSEEPLPDVAVSRYDAERDARPRAELAEPRPVKDIPQF